jgi:hypothetical protein
MLFLALGVGRHHVQSGLHFGTDPTHAFGGGTQHLVIDCHVEIELAYIRVLK